MRTGLSFVTPLEATITPNPLLVNVVFIVLLVVGFWLHARLRKRKAMSSRRPVGDTRLGRAAKRGYPWLLAVGVFVVAVVASDLAGVTGDLPDAALGWTLLFHVERAALLIGSIAVVALLLRALARRRRSPLTQKTVVAGLRSSLVLLGVIAVVAAVALRTVHWETSQQSETTDTVALGPAPANAKPVAPSHTTKTSTTEAPLSEAVMVALIGAGVFLVLVGILWDRLEKVTTPLGELQFKAKSQFLPPTGRKEIVEAARPGDPAAALLPLVVQEALERFDLVATQRALSAEREVRVAILGGVIDPQLVESPVFGGRVEPPVQDAGPTDGITVMPAQVGTIAAIAATARILPVAVIDQRGSGSASSLLIGLDRALAWEPHIVLLDLGFPLDPEGEGFESAHPLARAIRAASEGALLVAPAGNDGSERPHYPASDPHVLGCAALDRDDHLADFSSRGVPLAAPGVNIRCLIGAEGDKLILQRRSGTSMAAGLVTAVAALALAADESLEARKVWPLLYDHGFPVEGGGLIRGVAPDALAAAMSSGRHAH